MGHARSVMMQVQMMCGSYQWSRHIDMMMRRRMEVWIGYGRGRRSGRCTANIAKSMGVRQERRRNDLVVKAAPKAEPLQRVAVVAMRQRRAAQINASRRPEQLHGAQIVGRAAARRTQCLRLRLSAGRSRTAAQHAKRRRSAQLGTAAGSCCRCGAAHRIAGRKRRRDGAQRGNAAVAVAYAGRQCVCVRVRVSQRCVRRRDEMMLVLVAAARAAIAPTATPTTGGANEAGHAAAGQYGSQLGNVPALRLQYAQ